MLVSIINYVPVDNCYECIYMFDSSCYQNLVVSAGTMSHIVFCGQICDISHITVFCGNI